MGRGAEEPRSRGAGGFAALRRVLGEGLAEKAAFEQGAERGAGAARDRQGGAVRAEVPAGLRWWCWWLEERRGGWCDWAMWGL